MRSISGKEFARFIEQHGWTLLRVKGSHHIYGKPDTIVRLSVLIHGNKPLKTGLLRHLLQMAGLDKIFSEQSLMSPWLSQEPEKPGGTGVPPVQAQVENLCHLKMGRGAHRDFS